MLDGVVICGPVPEPVGGVSIHIARLTKRLEKLGFHISLIDEAPKIKSGIFNIRSLAFFQYFKIIRSADIVHIHSSIRLFLFIHLMVASLLRKPTVITLHSWREPAIKNGLWRCLFKLLKPRLIFVSHEIQQRIDLPGLVKEAYVHPDLDDEAELPAEVVDFVDDNKAKGAVICVSNAYRLTQHQGECLYGLDMCLEAIDKIKLQSQNNLVMIYVVANYENDQSIVAQYQQFIEDHKLHDHFLLYKGSLSFSKLLMAADMSVRATNTDGDALSVRESINLGCLTIASDCVARPEGSLLFKTRNTDDLVKVITTTAAKLHQSSAEKREIIEDCIGDIVNEYRLCEGK